MSVGKSIKRVDAFDKVTGRAKYTDDLCGKEALIGKVLGSTIAHGRVKHIDTSEAEAMEGVVKVLTCFDVPDIQFPTAGHPWSTDPGHQDVADRKLLNEHVRYYGDEIALVIAEDELTAKKALSTLKVEYEEYPFTLDVFESMDMDEPLIHEEFEHNILAHSSINKGDVDEAIKEEGLTKVEGWYHTPVVQHAHIEPHVCYAYQEGTDGRITVVASTQIPHIVRRVCAQALGIPWGKVRIVKPYIGGGFGNKQDALWEPLCAWATTQVGGRLVKIDTTREETFTNNRTRHSIHAHIQSWVRPDGTFAARKLDVYADKGAYASHGHAVVAKGMGAFPQLYPCDNVACNAYSVYTNKPTAGAMRGYGIPQAMFQNESHIDDICEQMGFDPMEFRQKNVMPQGYFDPFSKNENYYDTFGMLIDKAKEMTDFDKKRAEFAKDDGSVRRGIGMALFWYNTAVYPISVETSSCRMVLNQDGSMQLMTGETEIGQGCDTAYAQMASEATGIPVEKIHVVSTQDTDISPYGTGAYASRQTYIGGFSINQTGHILKDKILEAAHKYVRMPVEIMDIVDGNIVRKGDGRVLMSVAELATETLYNKAHSQHLTAESTYNIQSNAYSFGLSVAEVEVDIPLCKVKLTNLTNVHDCGNLINPQLAEAQVHGGMSMGIGFGLSEQLLFDEKTGRTLNNNLLDYKLSTFMDHPELHCAFIENPEPTSPFGTKSLGEPPACSPAPAIRNAILNATGVRFDTIPVTPHRMFEGFCEAGLIESEAERESRRLEYEQLKDTVIEIDDTETTEKKVSETTKA